MLDFYDIHKPNKKILLPVFACIIVLIVGILCFVFFYSSSSKIDRSTSEINSFDEMFHITIPNRLGLTSNRNTGEFLLDLYAKEHEIYIYCTSIKKVRAMDLYSAVLEDKTKYLSNKTNIRENSDITKLEHIYPCYEYSFKYLDTECNEDFYCNVVWYEIQDSFYILNFEVPSSTCEEFKEIFYNIKQSFVKI